MREIRRVRSIKRAETRRRTHLPNRPVAWRCGRDGKRGTDQIAWATADRQADRRAVSNEGDREIRRSNVPRRSVNALTCQTNFLRDDAAGRARGSDDRGGGGQSGRGDVRQGHAACGLAM